MIIKDTLEDSVTLTISILTYCPREQMLAAAAFTGNLCVGGWVLRADPRWGIVASQGNASSTLWGEQTLEALARGLDANSAVAEVTQADRGRAFRQLATVDCRGQAAAFTGEQNIASFGARFFPHGVIVGNMLADETVLDACLEGFLSRTGPLPERLLHALVRAREAGGDRRGLMSAALRQVSLQQPPLDLRIDYSRQPLEDLSALYQRTQAPEYADWCQWVPSHQNPWNHPQ